jgi:hypothetical protein
MVESEEKQKRIVEMLERWSKNVKVDHLLRPYDIPLLAKSIIEEFYHVSLCCGHWVKSLEEGADFVHKEWCSDFDGSSWSDISGIYCKDCYERMKKDYDENGYPKKEQ